MQTVMQHELSENIKPFSSYCNIAKNGRGPATPHWVLRHARQNFQNQFRLILTQCKKNHAKILNRFPVAKLQSFCGYIYLYIYLLDAALVQYRLHFDEHISLVSYARFPWDICKNTQRAEILVVSSFRPVEQNQPWRLNSEHWEHAQLCPIRVNWAKMLTFVLKVVETQIWA